MPLSEEMGRQFVDPAINPLFDVLYALPKDIALAAFYELRQLEMMDENENYYPRLPELFQVEIYQPKEIQDVLRQFCEIMYNRQPQDPVENTYDPYSTPVKRGKLNLYVRYRKEGEAGERGETELVSRSGESITAEDVHDYMRYKFFVAECNVIMLHETQKFIDQIKKDSARKKEYEHLFAKWVSAPEKNQEAIQKSMREFLLSDGVLKQKMKEVLMASLGQLYFQTFLHYFDGLIDNLFALAPDKFDSEMSKTLDLLSTGFFFKDGKQISYEVLKTSPYKEMSEKLNAQAEDPDEHYSYDVISSFLKIAELREKLNKIGSLLKENHPKLADQCERICRGYIEHLEGSTQDEQKPLSKEDILMVNQSYEVIDDLVESNLFVRDFFANYFSLEEDSETFYRDRGELLRKLTYLAFEKKIFHIGDNWEEIISRANPEEKGVLTIRTEHRNLIFLRAITLPVEKWTPAFYETFNKILTLLNHSADPAVQREKEFSYPSDFMEQLFWLRDNYLACTGVLKSSEIKPQSKAKMFLLYYPPYPPYPDNYKYARYNAIYSLKKEALYEIDWQKIINMKLETACSWFFYFSLDQLKVYLECIKNQLYVMIKNASDVEYSVRSLEGIKRDYFLEIINDKLPDLIANSNDFDFIFSLHKSQKKTGLFERVKDKLRQFVVSGSCIDFELIFVNLGPEQKAVFFEMVKDDLTRLVVRAPDFKELFKDLDESQKSYVFSKLLLENKFQKIIKSLGNLYSVFSCLDLAQKKSLIEKINLSDIAGYQSDFSLANFDNEDINLIIGKIKDRLPTLVNQSNYPGIFNRLDPEGRIIFLEGIKNKLPEWITRKADFDDVLNAIRPEEMAIFIESTKSILPKFVRTAFEFEKICKLISHPVHDRFFEIMKETLWMHKYLSTRFISTEIELCVVCRCLNPAQINELCKNLKTEFVTIIRSMPTFITEVGLRLDNEQKAALLENIKNYFDDIAVSKEEVDLIFETFPDQKKEICDMLHRRWEWIVETKDDLLNYMNVFQPAEQSALLEALRFKLPVLFQTNKDLVNFDYSQQELILNWALIGVLDQYIKKRAEGSDYSRFNKFAYSAADKIDAASSLKTAILQGVPLEQKHVDAMSNGELCRDIKAHFAVFRPGAHLKDFLNAKMQSSEHKHSPH
ncbi:MAG TPA: hypothetical protein VLJ15_08130 [Gammaproteobacteria bacterium]|nr:hypothetical protein [Gammaproteobacteria bacterium]